ncbi:MAG: DUF2029 domain-containing protein [Actinobacteria bacterium]|nr:DUF2029 domain-containing protein [Actinomycetota bacterium]
MGRAYRNLILPGTLAGLGAWLAFANSSTGDYPIDARPAVTALDHGHIGAYLGARLLVGPVGTLVEAPFALLGHGEPAHYRWVCLSGALAVAALGWYLFTIARSRGVSNLAGSVIALLCVVNPITVEAFRTGHPEELLTGALAIGAVLVAGRGHSLRAGLLLGLAVASKQWAVLAILPVLMALPGRRRAAVGVAAATVALLTLPALIASPGTFMDVQSVAASGGGRASTWNVWYPLAPIEHRLLPALGITVQVHAIPPALRPLTHPLIVASFLLVPLALWAWRGEFHLALEKAVALVALLALLRCALDPVDNLYYHAPLFLSLVAWDAVRPIDRLPVRSLLGLALVVVFWRWSNNPPGNPDLFNLVYVVAASGAAAMIVARLFGRREARTVATRRTDPVGIA